jgi:hypothetical protein
VSEHDLPRHIADAMRDVEPADPGTRDRHISAALDAHRGAGTSVIPFRTRRTLVTAAAAAVIAVLGGTVGWSVRSDGNRQMVAGETGSDPAVVAKGTSPSSDAGQQASPPATDPCVSVAPADSNLLGTYTVNGRSYSLYVDSQSVTWFDTVTCEKALVVPHPGTTVP